MVYTPMMYGGGMSPEVRENRKKRSLLGTEGSGRSPFFFGPISAWHKTSADGPVNVGWDVGKCS
jgi:hypothetical protein